MIGFKEIAEATSANDAETDEGKEHAQIIRGLGIDDEGLTQAATERALKAISVLYTGNPDAFRSIDEVIARRDAGMLAALSTMAGCFIDGFSAATRIGKDAYTEGVRDGRSAAAT